MVGMNAKQHEEVKAVLANIENWRGNSIQILCQCFGKPDDGVLRNANNVCQT